MKPATFLIGIWRQKVEISEICEYLVPKKGDTVNFGIGIPRPSAFAGSGGDVNAIGLQDFQSEFRSEKQPDSPNRYLT